jgi:phage regulator Rha-like protein
MKNVFVYLLTKSYLYYKCEFCNLIHSHGNEKESIIGNWTTRRIPHCSINRDEILLVINNYTIRKVF